MENRIKECHLDLSADRTSTRTMHANQLRLWLSSMAYVLISALRRIASAATRFADATCGTIRLKLFKIGAQVRISVRIDSAAGPQENTRPVCPGSTDQPAAADEKSCPNDRRVVAPPKSMLARARSNSGRNPG
jgi:hypothetical protein